MNSTIAQRIDKAKNFVKSENFIILNGDAIFDANLNQILIFMKKIKRMSALFAVRLKLILEHRCH